jgi:hypothetical protein
MKSVLVEEAAAAATEAILALPDKIPEMQL